MQDDLGIEARKKKKRNMNQTHLEWKTGRTGLKLEVEDAMKGK